MWFQENSCSLLIQEVHRIQVQYLYIKSRMFGSKHKSSGDIAGTGKRHQELEAQRKDEERQEEEITEELKRFMMQEMARGFYLRRHC